MYTKNSSRKHFLKTYAAKETLFFYKYRRYFHFKKYKTLFKIMGKTKSLPKPGPNGFILPRRSRSDHPFQKGPGDAQSLLQQSASRNSWARKTRAQTTTKSFVKSMVRPDTVLPPPPPRGMFWWIQDSRKHLHQRGGDQSCINMRRSQMSRSQ